VREAVLAITADRDAGAIGQWAVVLEEPFERFPGEIEPVEGRVAALEHGHSPQRLRVVIKAARSGEAAVERALAGMAEWRMPQIVPERERLSKVLIEAQGAGERAGDLGDFKRVGQPGAKMIALVEDKDLRLVSKAPKRRRMNDTVAVAAEIVAGRARRLGAPPPAAQRGVGRIGSALPKRL